MRYLILLILAGCATQETLDPSGLTAKDTTQILAPECVNPDGTECSSAGKSNVRIWERK